MERGDRGIWRRWRGDTAEEGLKDGGRRECWKGKREGGREEDFEMSRMPN